MKLFKTTNYSFFTLSLLFLIIIFSISSQAQPTLSMSDVGYQIGDVVIADTVNFVDVSSLTGANMTWDMNDLILGGANLSSQVLGVGEVESPIVFDGANMVRELDFGSNSFYQYYAVNDNDIQYLGYFADVGLTEPITALFSNPQTVINTPMTYGSQSNDSYNVLQNSTGTELLRSGVSSSEVVGYGTLLLNSETYTDVLLMNLTTIDTTVIVGSGLEFYNTDNNYVFYKAGYHHPLLIFTHNMEDGNLTPSSESFSGTILIQQTTTVGINESSSIDFSIFPNPVESNEVTIRFSNALTSDFTVRLYDPLGRQVELDANRPLTAGTRELKIRLTHELSAGMYQLVISGNEFQKSNKLIIQ